MKSWMHRIILYSFLLVPQALFGQVGSKLLFESQDVLEVTIRMNVEETIDDREERAEHPGVLSYVASDGKVVELNINSTVRGNNRANPKICSFPPLKLNFKKKQVAGTVFAGQNKLKLVTHCNSRPINEEYILREYHVYLLYQLVSTYSLQVRLCRIIYEDTEGEYDPTPHYGFFIEDIDELAEKLNMKEYKRKVINQDGCFREGIDRLMIFEYMIGNLDWSVPNAHNFKLIYGEAVPMPIAVPYDFDFSGIVNTSYAEPPADIPVSSVRERLFRGLCRVEGGYDPAIEYFKEIKPEIYSLYTQSPYLSEKSINQTLKYLDSFYKVIENPKLIKLNIEHACRAEHKHLYEQ